MSMSSARVVYRSQDSPAPPETPGRFIKDTGKLFAAPSALPEILGDLSDLLSCPLKVILETFPVLDAASSFNHGQQANDSLPYGYWVPGH